MALVKAIPLVVLTFPEKVYFYSIIDVNILNFKLPSMNLPTDSHVGINFKSYLLENPSCGVSFDIFNPKFSPTSIKISILNRDALHNYAHLYPLESINVLFVKYDINNNTELFRMYGKISEVSYDRFKFEFTLKDESGTFFVDQPFTTLKEDTFQTTLTLGPFDENPLKWTGLLVDVAPGPNGVINSAPDLWPRTTAQLLQDDEMRCLIAWIEHPALYNEYDDEYWVGSMVSIIEDPLPVNVSESVVTVPSPNGDLSNLIPCRASFNIRTGVNDVNSPYAGWPTGYPAAAPWDQQERFTRGKTLLKEFCLGASAYVIKCGKKSAGVLPPGNKNSNAQWNQLAKSGRLWFDTYGPNCDNTATPAFMAADTTRRLPNDNETGIFGRPYYQQYKNRTNGAKAMASLCNRHVIRIFRRPIPENVDSIGQAIPIAYGMINKGQAVHAIGGKAIGGEGVGCADHYIICSHPMCVRVCADQSLDVANYTYIERRLQFRDIKIWHSLDEFTSADEKLTNPAAKNENEYGIQSQNPFPRVSPVSYTWVDDPLVTVDPGGHYLTTGLFDPYVMWFNAGEGRDYRYLCKDNTQTPTFSRQIQLLDNKGNSYYSGIRLRGDEYWSSVSAISLDLANLPEQECYQNNTNAQYPIRNGLGNSKLYFDFNGEPDFDDGYITGLPAMSVPITINMPEYVKNPAGLVQHPADIIAHFLLKYTKINGDRGKIDWPSFRKTRGMLNGWRFSSFLNEVKKGEDIIGSWLSQCRSMLFYKNGRFYLRYIDLNANREVKYVFNDGNMDKDSLQVTLNGVGELYSKFTVKYDYYRPLQTWKGIIELDTLNNMDCKVAEQMYGTTEHFEFECPDVNCKCSAIQLTNYLLELYTKQRISLTLSSQINEYTSKIDPGDLVVIQCDELPNRVRIEHPNQRNILPSRLPFIVSNITPKESSYEYELLQLYPRSSMR